MVVGRHGNEFLGPVLADDIFVELLLDLVGSGDVVDGKNGLAGVFLFLFDFGAALAEAPSVAEEVSQVQEADRGAAPAALPVFCLPVFLLVRLLLRGGIGPPAHRDPDLDLDRVLVCAGRIHFRVRPVLSLLSGRGGRRGVPGAAFHALLRSQVSSARFSGPAVSAGGAALIPGLPREGDLSAEEIHQVLVHQGTALEIGQVQLSGKVHHLLHAVGANAKIPRQVDHLSRRGVRSPAHDTVFGHMCISIILVFILICHKQSLVSCPFLHFCL